MIFIVVLLLAVSVLVPLFYAWRVWRLREATLADWALPVANSAVIVALILILGRYDMAGYYTRLAGFAIVVAAAAASLLRHRSVPWMPASGPMFFRRKLNETASLVLFGAALVYVGSGLVSPTPSRDLSLPLTGGRFFVGQGGGIGLLNHHADHRQQRFAVDITALGPAGFRAVGIHPAELDKYEIFGASVVSPCDGVIAGTRDGLPDLTPPMKDRDNATGNHAIVDCGDVHVVLAHLRDGSVAVSTGQQVKSGDAIGQVGNSGNTTEPHLHAHAFDPATGDGMPMRFDGRYPVRNAVFDN